ncbi:DUF975 family protein [Eubacterium multiforme]|uniref:Membrane protein n=1 Tax=Eubacterium multiforme TaxID=83339 RepID=A0ABT9URL3_9FIRM|nr:DUF975 family protein [Eubacterium multiforme]MDQ0148244.1 putative membrane protein [Eubacterium multiforme]
MSSTGELKSRARMQLRGKWGISIVAFLIYSVIIGMGASKEIGDYFDINKVVFFTNAVGFLLGGLITVGISKFSLNLVRGKEISINDLFSNFDIYLKTLGLNILSGICIFIGTLFFVIPGVIIAIMFSQAYYILSEDKEKSITQCLRESSELIRGYKWDYFVLELSFIGWWIVSILTLGIGSLWVIPYQGITETNFYLELKENQNIY